MKNKIKKKKNLRILIYISIAAFIFLIFLIGIIINHSFINAKIINGKFRAINSITGYSVFTGKVIRFSGGTGTQTDPYRVSNCQELQDMKNDLDAYYILTNDIDCSMTRNWNNGEGFIPIGYDNDNVFSGNFDGQRHVINGLYIKSSKYYAGLFGMSMGKIANVGVINANISGGIAESGGLVSVNSGEIINCYIIGNLSVDGGLVGRNSRGKITNSYSSGNVYGSGGLVGANDYSGIISNSYSSANVINTGNSGDFGGLVGGIMSGGGIANSKIENSYSIGNIIINCSNNSNCNVGGLVGSSVLGSDILNSYSISRIFIISSNNNVNTGGIAGSVYNYAGMFKTMNSFSGVSVSGNYNIYGGLIGFISHPNTPLQITNFYYNNYSESRVDCIGNIPNSPNCRAILNNLSYFYYITNPPLSSWDFNNIWSNVNNRRAIPILKWQIPSSCNNGNCEANENCLICANDCICSGNKPDCSPYNTRADTFGCVCLPNWNCGAWSLCTTGIQTRTCTDTKNCGTNENKPIESQICGCGKPGVCLDDNNNDNVENEEILCGINKWVNSR